MKSKWKLDPKEVSTGGSTGTTGTPGGKKGARLKRCQMTLMHRPTGVSVELVIEPIIQTKDQWKKTYQKAWDEAFLKLEDKVAKHLQLPGR